MRVILLLHRYLAVCIGVVMTLWCLSGFVMMYQAYPDFTPEERLRALAPLDLADCCQLDVLPDDLTLGVTRVEMLGDSPVLRDGSSALDLRSGEWIDELSDEQILDVGRRYAQANGIDAQPRLLGRVDIDQWTIQSAYRNQPAHHIAFDDPAATEIYVNGATGEIFQETRRRERVLAWLGAIPHWLYPTVLRQNGALWSQVVIWASVIGTFLAATGLYVGIGRLERRRDGKLASPFRGWWYWHHIVGLVFGVLTLTWVFSGLLTMNPWGLLEGSGSADYRRQLTGEASWRDLRRFLSEARERIGPEFAQLRFASFNDELYVLALRPDGSSVRFDASGARADVDRADVDAAVRKLGVPVASVELLHEEDSFYYGHKEPVKLPVYRILLDDQEQTRLYLEPTTGALRVFDSDARWSRWIRRGLHGFDFAGIRARPIWDVLVILMLVGVTAVCVTGTWLAFKRVRLDYRKLRAYFLYNVLSSTRQVSQR
jgi:uncharacterized iron-regulated membrane protein